MNPITYVTNPQIDSTNPYALQQRQRLIDALKQQAVNPQQMQSAGAVVPRQSLISPLVQALSGYMSGKMQKSQDTAMQNNAIQKAADSEAARHSFFNNQQTDTSPVSAQLTQALQGPQQSVQQPGNTIGSMFASSPTQQSSQQPQPDLSQQPQASLSTLSTPQIQQQQAIQSSGKMTPAMAQKKLSDLSDMLANGNIDSDQYKELLPIYQKMAYPADYDLSSGQSRMSGYTDQPIAQAPGGTDTKLQQLPGGVLYDPTASAGQPSYFQTDINGKRTPLSSAQVRDFQLQYAGDKATATAAAQNKSKLAAVTPGSMDYAVEWAKQNNGVPPPGMFRDAASKFMFFKAMQDDAANNGQTISSQIAQSRMLGSLKPALEQTQKQIAANQSFGSTLEKNIASADELAKSVGGDGSPAMNEIFNKWKRGVVGDPNVRKLDVWNNAIQGEAAKIASGGVGSVSASSDTQLAKSAKLMTTADNYQTWRAAADTFQKEYGNRMAAFHDTLSSMQQQMATTGKSDTPKTTTAPSSSGWGQATVVK